MLQELGFTQDYTTTFYEDNYPNIDTVNYSISTERTLNIYAWFFTIQVWKEYGDINMHNIPRIINPADDLNKPLSWLLHSRHAIYQMWN